MSAVRRSVHDFIRNHLSVNGEILLPIKTQHVPELGTYGMLSKYLNTNLSSRVRVHHVRFS